MTGEIAKALTARANELFAVPPKVQKVEVLANTSLKQYLALLPAHNNILKVAPAKAFYAARPDVCAEVPAHVPKLSQPLLYFPKSVASFFVRNLIDFYEKASFYFLSRMVRLSKTDESRPEWSGAE